MPAGQFSVIDTMKQRVGPFAANKFNNAIQRSTISITSLRSGVADPPKENVIPSVAEATLDCRVLPGTTAAQWVEEIERRLADPTITIEVINEGDDPVITPQEAQFYRAAVLNLPSERYRSSYLRKQVSRIYAGFLDASFRWHDSRSWISIRKRLNKTHY